MQANTTTTQAAERMKILRRRAEIIGEILKARNDRGPIDQKTAGRILALLFVTVSEYRQIYFRTIPPPRLKPGRPMGGKEFGRAIIGESREEFILINNDDRRLPAIISRHVGYYTEGEPLPAYSFTFKGRAAGKRGIKLPNDVEPSVVERLKKMNTGPAQAFFIQIGDQRLEIPPSDPVRLSFDFNQPPEEGGTL